MNGFNFNRALQEVWKVIGMTEPVHCHQCALGTGQRPDQRKRLMTVLYFLAEALRIIALVLQPGHADGSCQNGRGPGSCREDGNGHPGPPLDKWGMLQTRHGSSPRDSSSFPGLTKRKNRRPAATAKKPMPPKKEKTVPPEDGLITFDQFGKVELRVARMMAAEKIAKADKLLKLTVKAPEERTIVAGIAQHYEPETLIGRLVLIVANLKPAKLMGVTSHGMVLAAKETDENGTERLVLATVADTVAPGSRVS